jgi:HAD superfamily hydrolase (TIGR01509 family)
MVSMLRAVVFDFNGVLVDDEPIHLEIFQRVLAEEGIELSAEDYYGRWLGLDDRGVLAGVLAERGQAVHPPRLMRLIARKASYYQDRIRRDGYPFYPGAAALVGQAAERGWVLAVVSGALRDEVEGALRQAGLRERFKVLVSAEDVAEGKPDPAGYLLALETMNTQPPFPERLIHAHEVLAVEDSPAGLEAAAAVGFPTLALGHSYPPERLTAAGATVPTINGLTADDLAALYERAAAV